MKCVDTSNNDYVEFGKLNPGDTFTCWSYDKDSTDVFIKAYTPNDCGTVGISLIDGRWARVNDSKIVHRVDGVFTYHTYSEKGD